MRSEAASSRTCFSVLPCSLITPCISLRQSSTTACLLSVYVCVCVCVCGGGGDRIRSDQMRCDAMRSTCDGMRWDGMRWDEIKMRWDGIRQERRGGAP